MHIRTINCMIELSAKNHCDCIRNIDAQAIIRFMSEIGITPTINTYKKLALGCKRSSDGVQLLKDMKVGL